MRSLVAILPAAAVLTTTGAASAERQSLRVSVAELTWEPGAAIVFARGNEIGPIGTFIYEHSGARRLARDAASPDWSPDGTRIALDYKQGIALIRPDGSGLRIIQKNAHQPHWSPDGRWIAFFFVFRDGVGIMRPDGSDVRQVGILRSDAPDRIAWSPDSKQLAFGAQDKGFFVVPIDGSRRQRRRRACPEWGPLGELAYLGKGVVTIVRSDGSRRKLRLTECPTWSPDGRRVAANGRASPLIAGVNTGRRWPIRVRPRPDTVSELAWSPDARRLAFTWPTGSGTRAVWGLYTVGAGGGRPRRLLSR